MASGSDTPGVDLPDIHRCGKNKELAAEPGVVADHKSIRSRSLTPEPASKSSPSPDWSIDHETGSSEPPSALRPFVGTTSSIVALDCEIAPGLDDIMNTITSINEMTRILYIALAYNDTLCNKHNVKLIFVPLVSAGEMCFSLRYPQCICTCCCRYHCYGSRSCVGLRSDSPRSFIHVPFST